jgi:hypothetical protein
MLGLGLHPTTAAAGIVMLPQSIMNACKEKLSGRARIVVMSVLHIPYIGLSVQSKNSIVRVLGVSFWIGKECVPATTQHVTEAVVAMDTRMGSHAPRMTAHA